MPSDHCIAPLPPVSHMQPEVGEHSIQILMELGYSQEVQDHDKHISYLMSLPPPSM